MQARNRLIWHISGRKCARRLSDRPHCHRDALRSEGDRKPVIGLGRL